MKSIKPPFLKKNDKVVIIATAKNFDSKELDAAIIILKAWGLKVELGQSLYKKYYQFAGSDQDREEDLQEALDNPEIKAVFCARGGYGTSRIIDNISLKKVTKQPKWVVGFSDVTVLHAQLQKQKIQSIHGLMPILFGKKEYKQSVEELRAVLFGEKNGYTIPSHNFNRHGKVMGTLVGGNLSIMCSIIGTNSEIDTKGKILFIEDVGENLYRIDRMIVQLKSAGVLKQLAGLIVGHFTAMEDNKIGFGKTAYQIIAEAVNEYNYPVCYGFPAGHEPHNMPIFLGAETRLSINKEIVTVTTKLE